MEQKTQDLRQALLEQGTLLRPIQGTSMLPLLRQGTDSVLIEAKRQRLHPLDVALYVRQRDGAYILHRVIACRSDGYLIRGDNCFEDEILSEDAVIGIMKGYYRKDKFISCEDARYQRRVKRLVKAYPLRNRLHQVKWIIKQILCCILKPNRSKS